MNISSIRYLIREGFRSIWQNALMAAASVGVLMSCLFVTGGAYLIAANIAQAFDWVYEQNVMAVYAEDCRTNELLDLQLELEGLDNVKEVELVTKEEMLEQHAGDLPPELYESYQGENNPMPDTFLVTFSDLTDYDRTAAHILTLEHVEDVDYNGDLANTLTELRGTLLSVGGWVIVLLLLVALFIITNTIKLTVYNRRLEVRIMKSVGATNAFIRIPFLVEGMVLGLVSGALAFGILYYVYGRLADMFTFGMMGEPVTFGDHATVLIIGFAIIGVLVGALGSAISVSRYLKEEVVHNE